MTDSDEDSAESRDGRRRDRLDWIDLAVDPALELPGTLLADLSDALRTGGRGGTPDAGAVEAARDRASIPEIGDLDVDAVVRPGEAVPHDRADAVVEAGGEAVDVAVEGSGEAATVLVDTGGEVVEVVVENGGGAAAEATAEVIVAALEGL
ncbi:MAG: hypothetical protein V5A37_07450 [Halobacteriales archaeon]